jgi:hypothetical protein
MAGLYPDNQAVSVFGEEVVWPGLDPATGKFTNGSFTDPLVKPSFIPADTINLILDNLAELITALGKTPDNTTPNQLAQAISAALALKANLQSPALTGTPTAPTPGSKNYSTQIASTQWVRDNIMPVGTQYTQYPVAASNDYATAFPAWMRPAALFGGTWTTIWDADRIFFRTGGASGVESDRANGYQGDAIRNITGAIRSAWIPIFDSSSGAFALDTGDYYVAAVSSTSVIRYQWARFNASSVVPTAPENRPSNRQFIIWQKTAL